MKTRVILSLLILLMVLLAACGKTADVGTVETSAPLKVENPPAAVTELPAFGEEGVLPGLPEDMPLLIASDLGDLAGNTTPDALCIVDEAAPDNANCEAEEIVSFTDDASGYSMVRADMDAMEEALMDLSMPDLNGSPVRVGDLVRDNRVTMLNVWGISCGPCLMEIPELVKLRERYKAEGFEIVGLTSDLMNTDGAADPALVDEAKEVAAELSMEYPLLVMSQDDLRQMHIIGTPTTFLVSSSGQVIGDAVLGIRTGAEWDRMIQNALLKAGTM